jgi:hypothetical protein
VVLGLPSAIDTANQKGQQMPAVMSITNGELEALQNEKKKTEEMSKQATEAQLALRSDAAAIRSLPAVSSAAQNYQRSYRKFEKLVRDTQPLVADLKKASAELASVKAEAEAKKSDEEAAKKQKEIDEVKEKADKVIAVGTSAIQGFKSGGWMGAAVGASEKVLDMAAEEGAAQAKSLASAMIVRLLKPDIEQTELELTNAKEKASRLRGEAEAKTMEGKLAGVESAAGKLRNAQTDIGDAAKDLFESEGLFWTQLNNAGLKGASKAIKMRRDMRTQHGVAMRAVEAYQGGVEASLRAADETIAAYDRVIELSCAARRTLVVGATLSAAQSDSFGTKMVKGWGRFEPGACNSDRTQLSEWLAAFDVLADELTSILGQIPGGKGGAGK